MTASAPLPCDAGALSSLLRAGDVAALDALTRCFGERMLAAARRRCRADDVDDAVQDALIGAWRAGPGFRGDGPLEGWLVRLVATACQRMRRGLRNDPALHVRDHEAVDDTDPALLAERAELAGVLGDALLALAPQDRAILLMTDGLGMKATEIAASTGLSAGAVRTRLSRSRARLRARLEAFRPGGG